MQPDVTAFDSLGPPQDRDIAELARLADSLVEQIAETRRRYGDMRAQLDDPAAPVPEEVEVEVAPPRHSVREEARMATLNLAISGVDREEAVAHLHRSFELEDPEDVVDEVYGSRLAPARPPKRRFRRRRHGS
jgi:hypothetical protein